MANLINFVIRRSMSSGVINHVTVVGGGLMGNGIAQVAAQNNYNVTLVDLDPTIIEKAKKSIAKNLDRVAKKQFKDDQAAATAFVEGAINRISGSTDVLETAKNTDLVIEAIVEKLEVKQKLFASIDAVAKPSTIFSSNTSSIPIAEIAKSTQRLDRFCGLHFFNPVPVMKLLEVIRIPETSDATFNAAMEFGRKVGKSPITCKDTPGFVVNRLLIPYIAESIRMLERGDASAKDIDLAMKLGAGYPMGPLELSDYVGLDTVRSVIATYHRFDPSTPLFHSIPLLDKLVAEGKTGIKSGEGFYKHTK